MSANSTETTKTHMDSPSQDLVHLRTRLWRRSSLLTCGVLLLALAAAWIANAAVANNINKSALLREFVRPLTPDQLVDAQKAAQPSVGMALRERYRQNAQAGTESVGEVLEWPHGYAPDNALSYEATTDVEVPFRVIMFEDGSLSFLGQPENVATDEQTIHVVKQAIEKRASGGPHLREQAITVDGRTWMWTTQVAAANPSYDPADPEGYQISFYASGDLSDYADDGMLAARVFSFVDITPSVIQLKYLAVILGVSGALGCVLLVIACRKIIDRALVPVAESQARQREFLIKASHELKTPMASLSSNLDALVANGEETVASQDRWTKNMREDIDELAGRTCELLELVASPDAPSDEKAGQSE